MRLLIFGLGYTGGAIARHLEPGGWRIAAVTRDGREGSVAFEDTDRVAFEIGQATHIVSTVAPDETDPILATYGPQLAAARGWLGYLSSTGVYGDTARRVGRRERADRHRPPQPPAPRPIRHGSRAARGCSGCPASTDPAARRWSVPREATRRGSLVPGQVFSRIHVDDIVAGVIAGFDAPAGAYNLADDLPAPQSDVVAYACALLGIAPPPLVPLEEAELSPQARAFYAENRRVANGKAKRVLGWRPLYPGLSVGPARPQRHAPARRSPAPRPTRPAATSDSPRTASRAASRSPGSARSV